MHPAIRWSGRIVAVVVGVLVVSAAATYGVSERHLSRVYEVRPHALAVTPDAASPALVETGRRLVKARGCIDCHGPGLAGQVMIDDPAFARLASANLTPGGRARSDADWERAVRHGVKPDGTPLLLMPSKEFNGLSDEEIAAIVSYARTLPAASAPLPTPRLGPIARGLLTAGRLPFIPAELIDHTKPHPARVAAEATPAFGAYLAAGCKGCHGDRLSGGPEPGGPPSGVAPKNLTPDAATGIGAWQEDQFVTALRTGVRPNGTRIDSTAMPIAMTREMTETELRALYRYLRTVPAMPYGNR